MKLKKSLTVFLAAVLVIFAVLHVSSDLIAAESGTSGFSFFKGIWTSQKLSNPPEIDLDSWNLILVNLENPIPYDFEVELGLTMDGYEFDARAADALDQLLSAGRAAGNQLVLTSAYRTYDYQTVLFEDKIRRVIDEQGVDYESASKIAGTVVAFPGTSEHQTGLAADIVCEYYNILDEGYADTNEAKWLRENCADYGFILRYDKDKQGITGIIYEPWHFRYVGVEAARYIMENNICLEEFVELY